MKNTIWGLKNLLALLVLLGGLEACSTGNSESGSEDNSTEGNVEVSMLESDLAIPSVVYLGEIFRKSGLEYINGITLDPNRVSDYNTVLKRNLALGVYWSDLTYSVLNGQTQKSIEYIETTRRIANEVGNDVFERDNLLARLEANIENSDSVKAILSLIDEKTDAYIDETESEKQALIIFIGGWAEGLYLAAKSTNFDEANNITPRIMEQMNILEDLIGSIDRLRNEYNGLEEIQASMKELSEYFNSLPQISGSNTVQRDLDIPASEMYVLGEKIAALRETIIE